MNRTTVRCLITALLVGLAAPPVAGETVRVPPGADSAAIQQALNRVEASGGGRVLLTASAEAYRVEELLRITTSNVEIDGGGATLRLAPKRRRVRDPVIGIVGTRRSRITDIVVRNLTIEAPQAPGPDRTRWIGTQVRHAERVLLHGLRVRDPGVGVHLAVGCRGVEVRDSIVRSPRQVGFRALVTHSSRPASNISFTRCLVFGEPAHAEALGWQLAGVRDVNLLECVASGAARGGFLVGVDEASANPTTGISFDRCQALGDSDGWTLHPRPPTKRLGDIRLVDCISQGNFVARGAVEALRVEGSWIEGEVHTDPAVALVHESSTLGASGPLPGRLRWSYHTPPSSADDATREQASVPLLSPLVLASGETVSTAAEWRDGRRPELMREWMRILGKLAPTAADTRWFGDISRARVTSEEQKDGYTRREILLPIETDFEQPHVLLLPDGQGPGPFPAVIAWTSTTPDYRKPEEWWGAWLARRGYVVLCGWSFIRNYRDGHSYRDGVNEVVYERFGHWLPMAKMVHDVKRELEYLDTLPRVDTTRVGFIGFSLSAKTAVYVGAFLPEIAATVSIDPHIAIHGGTNWLDPWYLDHKRRFDDIDTPAYPTPKLRGTVRSLLDPDPSRPGLERNHHELLALCAPRPFLLIGCSTEKESGAAHSDDRQSRAYVNSAREVYELLGVPERLEYLEETGGHRATSPRIDAAWQAFFERWLGGSRE